eukprot:11362969-Karenia_brevis.AAC.1
MTENQICARGANRNVGGPGHPCSCGAGFASYQSGFKEEARDHKLLEMTFHSWKILSSAALGNNHHGDTQRFSNRNKELSTVVLADVYARICSEVSYRSHVELSNRRRSTCPRYGAVVKAQAGHAPVPK